MNSESDSSDLIAGLPHIHEKNLLLMYQTLLTSIHSIMTALPGSSTDSVWAYLENRKAHKTYVRQDLLPLLVYVAISKQSYKVAIPLAACWTLQLAAAHLLDSAQDNGRTQDVNAGIAALGIANVALVQLSADHDTMCDILDAFGRVTVLGANAQDSERGRIIRTRAEYCQTVAGKAATIISAGVWSGGRLASNDPAVLSILKEFGLAWGMATQISDDCLDLEEDLGNGLFTLPMIEAVSNTNHPDHPLLETLSRKPFLQVSEVQTIANILREMGTIDACRRMARAYQVQAAAAFSILPELEPFFRDYVTPEF